MLLSILFCFTSCEKDEIDTWVSLEADKTVVAAGETVTFKMSGNAETYVIYTGDIEIKPTGEQISHVFADSYLVITGGRRIDDEDYVLKQSGLDAWTPILTAEIAAYNIANPNTPLNVNTIINGLQSLVDNYVCYQFYNKFQRLCHKFHVQQAD